MYLLEKANSEWPREQLPSDPASVQAVANGDSSAALSVASIYAQTFSQTSSGPSCDPQSASAAARERILSEMLKLDSVTYSSSTYILQVLPKPIRVLSLAEEAVRILWVTHLEPGKCRSVV